MSTPEFEKLLDRLGYSKAHLTTAELGSPLEAIRQAQSEYRAARTSILGYVSKIEEDKARLDWMEMNPGELSPQNAVSPGWNMEGFHDEEEGWGSEELNLWRPTLRKAIDAARLSGHPSTKPGEPEGEGK